MPQVPFVFLQAGGCYFSWLNISLCMYTYITSLFTFSLTLSLSIVNNAAITWEYRYLFKILCFHSLEYILRSRIARSYVVLFLIFWGTSILFSRVAATIYILTKSVPGFPFLHILTNTCCLLSFWCVMW